MPLLPHRYEEKAIKGMFATNQRISPVTNERMTHTNLEKNEALLQRIEEWVEEKVDEEEFHNMADKDGQGGADEAEIAREWARRYEEKYGSGHQGSASLSAVKYKFFELDANKSGELDGDEATQLASFIIQSFGGNPEHAEEEAAKLIKKLDKDLDGHIGFDEFEKYYEEKAAQAAKYAEISKAQGKEVENKLKLGEDIVEMKDEDWESKIMERIFTGQAREYTEKSTTLLLLLLIFVTRLQLLVTYRTRRSRWS